jgi:nucleotide-binding universal stress UspA family protein
MNKILHGLDGSPNSFKALEEAIQLAKDYGAELHTISVEEIPHFPETVSEVAEEKDSEDSKFHDIVKKAQEIAQAQNCRLVSHILVGHVYLLPANPGSFL